MQSVHEYSNAMFHQKALATCNLIMGVIFHNQGHFEDAPVCQKKAYNMAKKCLPFTQPIISECLGPLTVAYMNKGEGGCGWVGEVVGE
jgi:hypothetical protein